MSEREPGPRVSSPEALCLAHALAASVLQMEQAIGMREEHTHDEVTEALACCPDDVLASIVELYAVSAAKAEALTVLARDELRRRGKVQDG